MFRKGSKYGVKTSEDTKSIGSNMMYCKVRAKQIMLWEGAPRRHFQHLVEQMNKWRQVKTDAGHYIYKAPGSKSDHIMALIVGIIAVIEWPGVEKIATGPECRDTANVCLCGTGGCGKRPEFIPVKRVRLN